MRVDKHKEGKGMITTRLSWVLVVAGVAAILVMVIGHVAGQAPLTRVVVFPAGSPRPPVPVSPGIKVGNIVYTSGQIDLTGPGVREQTEAVLKHMRAIVEAAGSSMAKVDKCTVFLAHAGDYQTMNEVYRTFFPTDPPARSTIITALFAPNVLVSIECIAHT
jgi:reactive intermediate/imine deaminase